MRLEIIVEWRGTVLEVRHLREGEALRLEDYVRREGVFAEVRDGEARYRAAGGWAVLRPGERTTGEVDGLRLHLAHTEAEAPPPRAGMWTLFDREGLGGLGIAAAIHAMWALVFWSMPVDADSLKLAFTDTAERVVTVFSSHPEKPEPPPPTEAVARGGEGPGDGEPSDAPEDAPAAEGREGRGPEARRAEKRRIAKGVAESVANAIDAGLASAGSPLGEDARTALDGMFDDGFGRTAALLGPPGPGRGNKGIGPGASIDPIAIPRVASTGRPGGPRRGVPERGTRQPKAVPLPPKVSPGLDQEQVRRVIRRHRNEYRYCYERELQLKNDLQGKVTIRFVIGANGKVVAAAANEDTVGGGVGRCIRDRVLRWQFPAPGGGGTVVVSYPFLFKRS